MDVLIVVDMQYDFIDGSLGSKDAQAILPFVKEKIENFDGKIIFTKDTHSQDYLDTMEGLKLPICHCIKNTDGHNIHSSLNSENYEVIEKPCFGSALLIKRLEEIDNDNKINSITLIGLCTDVCVVSNAITIKTFFPEKKIIVDSKCCAGITVEGHEKAIYVMQSCHIDVV